MVTFVSHLPRSTEQRQDPATGTQELSALQPREGTLFGCQRSTLIGPNQKDFPAKAKPVLGSRGPARGTPRLGTGSSVTRQKLGGPQAGLQRKLLLPHSRASWQHVLRLGTSAELVHHCCFPGGRAEAFHLPEKGNNVSVASQTSPIQRRRAPVSGESLSAQSSPGEEAGGREQYHANLTEIETEARSSISAHPELGRSAQVPCRTRSDIFLAGSCGLPRVPGWAVRGPRCWGEKFPQSWMRAWSPN